ncbi:N-acetyl-gamma-glutamyl-phosphate reductase [Demequina sp. B12]|uniref:N-acetyl-gamma-glutamyl-phosphate reductase n=1 Tax=Demequina sp. B12 TaxID=2992757 RepID=UPI00237C4260|nr:N-acetyl-gamma-glutamyl-phosphate reductase [Demequina sp. B12]MDE0573262.1 N-acetyl-gamma-glutamyl-phosphate reductase [Demequina sp. B12]
MPLSVAVSGASGYVGGEVLRVFSEHPDVEFGTLAAHSSAGDRLGVHQPHLRTLADREIVETSAETLAGHDVVVLALPHGASAAIAAQLPPETLVIDCGADHRLASSTAWAEYYGGEHAGTWPYGMPELITSTGHQRDNLPGAKRIAVPGCNVTAVTLGLQPGVKAGVIDPTDIVAVLANGYSGAGKKLATNLLASEGLGAASAYGVGGVHRHIPEIVQNLGVAGADDVKISFTPTLVPMARGILATITAPLAAGVSADQVRNAWEAAYADEPFVHLLPEGQWPTTAATLGANTCLVQVAVDEKAGRVVVIAAIDNLVKGTAGAALQSMNVVLGYPETTGLQVLGVAP